MATLLHLLIIIVALGGWSIAFHIRRKKNRTEKLVCPLNSNCETVVHSRYSTFLGLPLEWWGLGYYSLIALAHLALLFSSPAPAILILPMLVLWLTVFAFLFSFYLTYVQAAKLHEWCAWCLISALFCSIIFLTSLAIYS